MIKEWLILHFSKEAVANVEKLDRHINYQWVSSNYNFYEDSDNLKLFTNHRLNRKYRKAIFVFQDDSQLLDGETNFPLQLPNYNIICHPSITLTSAVREILTLKNTTFIDFSSINELNEHFKYLLTNYEYGHGVKNNHIVVNDTFKHQVIKFGNSFIEIKGPFGKEYQQVLTWRMTDLLMEGASKEFYPEVEASNNSLDYFFRIYIMRYGSNKILKIIDVSKQAILNRNRHIIESEERLAIINITLFVKGESGKLKLSQLHLRPHIRSESELMIGGKKIVDFANYNGEIFYYFDPGDLKPPLSVYFSGYRTAEGFEGLGIMSESGGPFLLVADTRLEGGNFFMGSRIFEEKLVELIYKKLELLNFNRSDLILMGLSMGTFAALYYASDLAPHSVIVGKPLVNIGRIALNEKLIRPGGFPTSLDMLYYHQGESTIESAELLNLRFWRKFKEGIYDNTKFLMAYMKHDDYDDLAFPMLFDTIKKNYPNTQLLYKGFDGRHNDNTPGIVNWFLKQYRNILKHSFGRKNV